MRKLFVLALLAVAPATQAAQCTVAVAANFMGAMKTLAPLFEKATGDTVRVSFGSTGGLYAQIVNGAPYQVFLAADTRRPDILFHKGLGDKPFTYAIGKLALWSPDPKLVDAHGKVLGSGKFAHLAIANPKTAPYGAGAMQVLAALGLKQKLAAKLVLGENIAQTYQFVASGSLPLGFVAISQIKHRHGGSEWIPPQSMYTPIRQDAILLKSAAHAPAAQAFVRFLKSRQARSVIESYGYATN